VSIYVKLLFVESDFMSKLSISSLRLGTRGSALALWQAAEVERLLKLAHPTLQVERVVVATSGDKNTHVCLADIGGKALFAKELEDALLGGEIDVAVHSMKDMETVLPEGLIIPCVLEREDTRDALLSHHKGGIDALPQGAVVGTSSVRRAAMIRHARPDIQIVPFRGNVQTRIAKWQSNDVDATLLALAGLKRLGLQDHATYLLSHEESLPAVSQGAIGVECREKDKAVLELLAAIHHQPTFQRITAERACLNTLGGSCRTPVGVHAVIESNVLSLKAILYAQDGSQMVAAQASGEVEDADAIGRHVGAELVKHGANLL
jgi:hydroxymethylbilane synthase